MSKGLSQLPGRPDLKTQRLHSKPQELCSLTNGTCMPRNAKAHEIANELADTRKHVETIERGRERDSLTLP